MCGNYNLLVAPYLVSKKPKEFEGVETYLGDILVIAPRRKVGPPQRDVQMDTNL